jgi:hypothetical protein
MASLQNSNPKVDRDLVHMGTSDLVFKKIKFLSFKKLWKNLLIANDVSHKRVKYQF